MQHGGNDECNMTNPDRGVTSNIEDVLRTYDLPELKSDNQLTDLSTISPSVSFPPLEKSSLSGKSDSHSSFATYTTSSYSYFNSQTGTSIVHINSNSPVSNINTVRENSNYIEKQWAKLKEKMLPTQRYKHDSKLLNRDTTLPGYVEERCEVDFSYIDEPVGNELEDSDRNIKVLNFTKSKKPIEEPSATFSKSFSFDSSSTLLNNFSKISGTKCLQSPPPASSRSITSSSFCSEKKSVCTPVYSFSDSGIKKDLPLCSNLQNNIDFKNVLTHSSTETTTCVSKTISSASFFSPQSRLLSSQPPLLVPSFKDEFLSSLNPISGINSEKDILKKRLVEEPTESCVRLSSPEIQTPKLSKHKEGANSHNEAPKNVPASEERKPPSGSVDDISTGASTLLDIQQCAHDNESDGRSLESYKSKRYQDMLSRKKLKEKHKDLNTIKSNQVPDYKGNNSLEEIISFINKDIKHSTDISLSKSSKKSKKKSKEVTKHLDNSEDLLTYVSCNDKIESKHEVSSKEDGQDSATAKEGKSDPTSKGSSCDKNSKHSESDLCEIGGFNGSFEKVLSDSGEEVQVINNNNLLSQSVISRGNKVDGEQFGSIRNSFSDCESFSVVQKKKKAKQKMSRSPASSLNKILKTNFIEKFNCKSCISVEKVPPNSENKRKEDSNSYNGSHNNKVGSSHNGNYSCKIDNIPATNCNCVPSKNQESKTPDEIGVKEADYPELITCKTTSRYLINSHLIEKVDSHFSTLMSSQDFKVSRVNEVDLTRKKYEISKNDKKEPDNFYLKHLNSSEFSKQELPDIGNICSNNSPQTTYMPSNSTLGLPTRVLDPLTNSVSFHEKLTNHSKRNMPKVEKASSILMKANCDKDNTRSSPASKSRSSFNLRLAQAYMNSTFQQVLEGKGYILYKDEND